MLEKCNTFFKWFKTVSTVLGGDKYVTIPMVVVAFNMLIDNIEKLIFKLNAKKDRNKVDEMLIIAFQAGRDKMLKHYSKTNWTYCSSLILDPRHKMESFDVTSWGQEMKTDAIKVFKEMYRNYRKFCHENHEDCRNETSTSDAMDISTEDEMYLDSIYVERKTHTEDEELDSYENSLRASKDCDILNWWKFHQNTYPTLSKMARDIFGITATSVPAERLFSKASLVIRKHRNRLNATSAEIILCMNSWLTCSLRDKIKHL